MNDVLSDVFEDEKAEGTVLLTVTSDEAGERVDVYLSDKLGITRSASQKLLTDGAASFADGSSLKKNARVCAGDEFAVTVPDDVFSVLQDLPQTGLTLPPDLDSALLPRLSSSFPSLMTLTLTLPLFRAVSISMRRTRLRRRLEAVALSVSSMASLGRISMAPVKTPFFICSLSSPSRARMPR